MAKVWEVRGLFGNEYGLEQAVSQLKTNTGFDCVVLDRRNLSVRFKKRDEEAESMVKRVFEINHGWTEAEGPLGEYDRMKEAEKLERMKKDERNKKKRK